MKMSLSFGEAREIACEYVDLWRKWGFTVDFLQDKEDGLLLLLRWGNFFTEPIFIWRGPGIKTFVETPHSSPEVVRLVGHKDIRDILSERTQHAVLQVFRLRGLTETELRISHDFMITHPASLDVVYQVNFALRMGEKMWMWTLKWWGKYNHSPTGVTSTERPIHENPIEFSLEILRWIMTQMVL